MAPPKAQGVKVTLYWLDFSRAHRMLWLLEELGLQYDVKVFHRGKDQLAPAEMREIHPLGKSPIIRIEREGQEKSLVLAESAVIMEYLIDHFGPHLAPKRYPEGQEGEVCGESEAFMRYRWCMHFSEGSMMPLLVMKIITASIRNAPVPFFLKPITRGVASKIEDFLHPEIKSQLKYLESQQASAPDGGPYLCGSSLTGADFIMSFPLQGCKQIGMLNKEEHPKLHAYVEQIEGTDSYKRAVEKTIELDGSFQLFF